MGRRRDDEFNDEKRISIWIFYFFLVFFVSPHARYHGMFVREKGSHRNSFERSKTYTKQ